MLHLPAFLVLILASNAFGIPQQRDSVLKTCQYTPPSTTSSKGPQCGVKGQHKDGTFYESNIAAEPARVSSVSQCAYLCARRVARPDPSNPKNLVGFCQSFDFNPNDRSCQLIQTSVAKILEPNSTTREPNLYYDLACFKCQDQFCDTPKGQTYGSQLLDNPGFESDLLGPWISSRMTIVKRRANTYVEALGNGYIADTHLISQDFDLCGGEYYDISFDYIWNRKPYQYSGATTEYPIIRASVGGDDDHYSWGTGLGAASAFSDMWRRGRFIHRASGIPQYSDILKFYNEQSNFQVDYTLAIDNVTVFRRPDKFSIVPNSVSPVPNGDFESGHAGPWDISTDYASIRNDNMFITSPGVKGSKYALSIDLLKFSPVYIQNTNFTTKPNTLYVMEVDFAFSKPGKKTKNLDIEYYVLSQGAENVKRFEGQTVGPDVTSLRWPMYVGGKSADVLIYVFQSRFDNTGGTLIIDNIRLREVSKNF